MLKCCSQLCQLSDHLRVVCRIFPGFPEYSLGWAPSAHVAPGRAPGAHVGPGQVLGAQPGTAVRPAGKDIPPAGSWDARLGIMGKGLPVRRGGELASAPGEARPNQTRPGGVWGGWRAGLRRGLSGR